MVRRTEEEIKSALRERLILWLTVFNEKGAASIIEHLDEKEMFGLYTILKSGIGSMNESIDP